MFSHLRYATLALLFGLAACGGGGDDPPTSADPPLLVAPVGPFSGLVADAVRGKTLYLSVCARCHAPDPGLDVRGVNGAAGTPGNVLSAIENINRMRFLVGQISPQDAVDLAVWIAEPF